MAVRTWSMFWIWFELVGFVGGAGTARNACETAEDWEPTRTRPARAVPASRAAGSRRRRPVGVAPGVRERRSMDDLPRGERSDSRETSAPWLMQGRGNHDKSPTSPPG